MKRLILITGHPRSATVATKAFIAEVLKKPAFHECAPYVYNGFDWVGGKFVPGFDIENPSEQAKAYPSKFLANAVSIGDDEPVRAYIGHGLMWCLHMIEGLCEGHYEIEPYFILRPPRDACNSFMVYSGNVAPLERFVERWVEYHIHAWQVFSRMQHKPKIMPFGSLTRGALNKHLVKWMGAIDIDTTAMMRFWETKRNHTKQYTNADAEGFGLAERIHDWFMGTYQCV